VRVGDKIGPGKIKVSMSFASWKAGHVAPATYEIPFPTADDP
jgi:hypothetical protein